MTEWKSYIVSELEKANLLKVEDGNHGEYRPQPNEFVIEGVAFIRSADIENGKILFQSASRINETAVKRIRKGIGKPGDTLFTSKGTVGKFALASWDCEPFICSPQVTFWRSLKHNFIDYRFLYYYIQSSAFLCQVSSRSRETDMAPYISLTNQREFKISTPEIKEQKQIADVLSCLDAKIDNLRRQNETLEQIAQTLFKHWFIDFEFSNADGKPYKSSGGAMIPSELGDIPESWRVGTLKECLEHLIDNRGKTPVFLTSGITALSAKFVKKGEIVNKDNLNYISFDLFEKSEKLKIGDVIMTSEAPLGETYFIAKNTQYYPAQRVFALRANDEIISPSYLNYWLISSIGQSLVQRRASGSTVQGIKQSELYKCEIIIPDKEINNKASNLFMKILLKKELNSDNIQTLTKTRDALLPKLMSGQIRVEV